MTTIGTSSLYSGTINGLNSLDLDTLNVSNLDANDINGDFFSINTIECNDLQVDNELDLTTNGVIKIGKNTPSEITITDTQLGYLDGVSSNIQTQLNTLTTDLDTAESNITTLQSDLDTAESNISTLQSDLDTAESEIDTLQTDVNALETLTENIERSGVVLRVNSTIDIRDAFVDDSIENIFPPFTYFDKNIIFSRSSGYREYFLGMTGDNTNAGNRFAIACNDSNGTAEPEILLEIPKGGNLRIRNGISIYDLLGNNVGTINNYSDSPNNSTFSIITQTGNMFLQSNSLIDCWSPALTLGQSSGSTLTMRTDTSNTNRSKIILDDITIFGGIGNVANDAYIQLNGETQNHAYTDADHTAVNGIASIESDITTINNTLATLSPIPSGSVQAFAGNTLPSGWLWCNGAEVSQTTYSALYSAIGTIYSTNRKTSPSAGNFFLPDLRGCYIAGAGQPQSTSFNFKITPASKSVGQFREMSVQDHKHNMIVHDGSVQVARTGTGGSTNVGNDADTQKETFGLNYADSSSFVSNPYINAGETQPFNICMNYIIKY